MTWLIPIAFFGAAGFLWWGSEKLANLFLGKTDSSAVPDSHLTETGLLRVGLVLIGVYILSTSLPAVANNLLVLSMEETNYSQDIQLKVKFASDAVALVIGILLTVGSRTIGRLIYRVRNYGA